MDRDPDGVLARQGRETSYSGPACLPIGAATIDPFPKTTRTRLQTAASETETWKVYALINHSLSQIFIAAMNTPMSQVDRECKTIAAEIVDWEPARQKVEWVPVEQFPTQRHAKAYAAWLLRDGALEGLEHYAMGLDTALA